MNIENQIKILQTSIIPIIINSIKNPKEKETIIITWKNIFAYLFNKFYSIVNNYRNIRDKIKDRFEFIVYERKNELILNTIKNFNINTNIPRIFLKNNYRLFLDKINNIDDDIDVKMNSLYFNSLKKELDNIYINNLLIDETFINNLSNKIKKIIKERYKNLTGNKDFLNLEMLFFLDEIMKNYFEKKSAIKTTGEKEL